MKKFLLGSIFGVAAGVVGHKLYKEYELEIDEFIDDHFKSNHIKVLEDMELDDLEDLREELEDLLFEVDDIIDTKVEDYFDMYDNEDYSYEDDDIEYDEDDDVYIIPGDYDDEDEDYENEDIK